ncbi:DUF6953 family protein [Bradyrhizobium sp. USDA 3315]
MHDEVYDDYPQFTCCDGSSDGGRPSAVALIAPATERSLGRADMMTNKDVAEWMIKLMGDSHWLYQETVVRKIKETYGDEYVYTNDNGNLAISKGVLKEFRKLTAETLVWQRGEKAWRPRRPHETGRSVAG